MLARSQIQDQSHLQFLRSPRLEAPKLKTSELHCPQVQHVLARVPLAQIQLRSRSVATAKVNQRE